MAKCGHQTGWPVASRSQAAGSVASVESGQVTTVLSLSVSFCKTGGCSHSTSLNGLCED